MYSGSKSKQSAQQTLNRHKSNKKHGIKPKSLNHLMLRIKDFAQVRERTQLTQNTHIQTLKPWYTGLNHLVTDQMQQNCKNNYIYATLL